MHEYRPENIEFAYAVYYLEPKITDCWKQNVPKFPVCSMYTESVTMWTTHNRILESPKIQFDFSGAFFQLHSFYFLVLSVTLEATIVSFSKIPNLKYTIKILGVW